MTSIPRIITADPSWTIARVVRAVIELTDRTVIQIDVPGGGEALDEINRGGCTVMLTALELNDQMKGFELALRAKQTSPDTAVIILADVDDPERLDEETRAESPFIYLHRPVDLGQFVRVLNAALDGQDIFAAFAPPPAERVEAVIGGAIPALDVKAAQSIIDHLLTDIGAMAIVLSNRGGEVLLERGAVGYLDREQLTGALLPMVQTTMAMGDLVGGQAAALQFYDGDSYDVFVLSVGLHHFMCLVFDGQVGARQFGAVTRFGRRAAEDLAALIGASAFLVEAPVPVEEKPRRAGAKKKATEEVAQPVEQIVARAEAWEEEPSLAPEPLRLEPIKELDLSIFDQLGKMDGEAADDLFDPEKLAEIAKDEHRGRAISYEEARQIGLIP